MACTRKGGHCDLRSATGKREVEFLGYRMGEDTTQEDKMNKYDVITLAEQWADGMFQ